MHSACCARCARSSAPLSYTGLILLFDEVGMASVGAKAEKLATDTLREVIDRTREDLPRALFVYAVPPQFINDIVPKYPALQQRVRAPGRFSYINHFSPLINLEHLDLDEDDLLLTIGEKLVPIYEAAFETQLDPAIQAANANIHQRRPRRFSRRQSPSSVCQIVCRRAIAAALWR